MAYQFIYPRGAVIRASYICKSPEETEKLATSLALALEAGDVLPISGDLGAGKTCFARGLARGLGVKGEVASPSFTYLREHAPGRTDGLAFYHFDCYRLHSADSWFELGFDEYLQHRAISLIEWPEIIAEALPKLNFGLALQRSEQDNMRILEIVYSSALAEERKKKLASALQSFSRIVR